MRAEGDKGRQGEHIAGFANMVVRIVGGMIFLALSWYALRYTQYMVVGGPERPVNVRDSVPGNLLAAAVAILLLTVVYFIKNRVSERIQSRLMYLCVAFSMLWTGAWGYWWIRVVDRLPEGDQAFIYAGASYFQEGQFVFLDPGGYCGLWPHQLPLIALVELLFLAVGTYNYFACQVVCVLFSVGIVWMGYRLLWEMTEDCFAVIFYALLMLGCFPLVFYAGWVYGDIPGTFFVMAAAYLLLRYEKTKKGGWLAGMAAAVTLALMVRLNSMIFVVALCLVGAVHVLRKKDWKLLLAIVLCAVLPVLAYSGVYKMYELRSGKPHAEGIATWSYIAMGMQEADGKYGWYTPYCSEVFRRAEFDPQMAAKISRQDAAERAAVFWADRAYLLTFYREKILSQWNEPLCQSLYFGNKFPEPKTEEQAAFIEKLNGFAFDGLLRAADRIQFVVYLGTAFYFLFAARKKSDILRHLLAVTAIGGFFFSILWEAKARYVVPYYVPMFPLAVAGYREMTGSAARLLERFSRRKEQQEGGSLDNAA